MGKPTPIVAANWKSNGTQGSIKELLATFNTAKGQNVQVVVAPTAIHIGLVQQQLENPLIELAVQNCIHKAGAFTGEVNVDQVADLGIGWVILGHSERRAIYGETDEKIAEKVTAVLAKGLKVIACVGESEKEREDGRTEEVVLRQVAAIVSAVPEGKWDNVVIAYEPVWAIGTGKVATPEQAQAVHKSIRSQLEKTSQDVAAKTRILYGGSVNAKNANELYKQEDINGFLVGGASLKPEFLDVIAAASQ